MRAMEKRDSAYGEVKTKNCRALLKINKKREKRVKYVTRTMVSYLMRADRCDAVQRLNDIYAII